MIMIKLKKKKPLRILQWLILENIFSQFYKSIYFPVTIKAAKQLYIELKLYNLLYIYIYI